MTVAGAGRDHDHDLDTRVESVPAWLFWGATGLGIAVIGFGVYGAWIHRGAGILDVRLRPMLTWGIGAIAAHDLLFAPTVLLVGRSLRTVRPASLRAPLQAGLAVTAVLTLLAFPLIRGYGVRASEPSRLPLNYTVGYLALVALVWVGSAGWAWWRAGACRITPPTAPPDPLDAT